ncbi:MAG TPA: ABC transporter ATP-binding protein [Vicinamibacterales bacterium]|nr:ABC transporter ATP-binding protein [Vicinamibacterales bacterium]
MTTPATGSLAIDARGLRKEFGGRPAVRDLTLSVPRGEIFGFLGPNGAGKSTSIKMFLGLVHPTAGRATLLGAPIGDRDIRQRIGFLPEDFRFYDWLTASELLELHGQLSGMAPRRARMRVPEALELVGMSAHAARRLRGFSKGMLQRLGLAQALIHEPDLIFLDAPTSGLDPMGRRMVRDVIRAQRDRGATVFLNSHLLSEIEVTCERVAFIKDGAIVESRDLRREGDATTRQVRITARNVTPAILTRLAEWSSRAELNGDELVLDVASDDVIPTIVRSLVTAGADVSQVVTASTSLEEIFVRLVGEDRGL